MTAEKTEKKIESIEDADLDHDFLFDDIPKIVEKLRRLLRGEK